MAARILRGVIVGASSLLGKELAEELEQSSLATWDLTLASGAQGAGASTDGAGEADEAAATPIQPITADLFAGADVVFFAGDATAARTHWQQARAAGAGVVDLTGALAGLPGVHLRCASIAARGASGDAGQDTAMTAVTLAHPAAMMLALVAQRLRPLGLRRIAATVLEPASQLGSAGVSELHRQTVALLSFKPLVQEVFGAQVAFNVQAALGEEAKVDLVSVGRRIVREVEDLASAESSAAIAVQVLQAPVFHGSTASVLVELTSSADESAVRAALSGNGIRVAASGDASVSNEAAAGSAEIVVMVSSGGEAAETNRGQGLRESTRAENRPGTAFWLWMAADNLRLLAHDAAGCAAQARARASSDPRQALWR